MRWCWLCQLVMIFFLGAACSSGSDDGQASTATTDAATDTTTTTIPPPIDAVVPNLSLQYGQCYFPTTTTTANPLAADSSETTTTIAGTTTLPRPVNVGIVNCDSNYAGVVYHTLCLGQSEEPPIELIDVACPGPSEIKYPGDRTIRRAAARLCLKQFEEIYREPYAVSSRTAEEFVPTEGLWNLGDRRVVCLTSREQESD